MSGKSGGAERRTAQRIQTYHHVVFSEYSALGPLRMGTAVDRSSGGLRIITSHPEPLGTTIQIELRASAGSPDVLLLEGRVVHLTPMDKGQCAMGIRLIQPALRAGAVPVARERRVMAARTPVTAGATGVGARAGGAPAIAGTAAATADEEVTFRRIEDGGRAGSWAALFAILALLVILVLLILEAMRDENRRASFGFFEGAGLEGVLAKILPEDAAASARASGLSRPQVNTEAGPAGPERVMRDDRGRWTRRGSLAPVESAVGAPALPGEISNAVFRDGASPESRRAAGLSAGGFAAMLEYADRAAARGEEMLAEFPVRLGRDAATPRGEFRVGTKARQPGWYSEGRVVPGGVPENPIGDQWFGLA